MNYPRIICYNENMKIGIGFVTGRKGFKHLFRTYVNNWSEYGFIQDQSTSLRLFVAYDLSYVGTQASDYKRVDPELAGNLDGLSYFGATRIAEGTTDARQGWRAQLG